jgi:hypothetical protein
MELLETILGKMTTTKTQKKFVHFADGSDKFSRAS